MDNNKQSPERGALNHRAVSAQEALETLSRLIEQGNLQASLRLAEESVRRWPNYEPLLLSTAKLALQIGRQVAAQELYTRAKNLGSAQAAFDLQAMIDQSAPHWHFRMMNDEIRNNAYDAALRKYVRSDSIVLDIGCGAGLLSMMAARAGAQHVYACDVSELLHHQAQGIFEKNDFSNKITAFHEISNNLKVGQHLPRKADIIVAEVFDSGLLGEEALTTFAHAREHLLAPGGIILPGKASIQVRLIESDLLHKESVVNECAGFDVSPLNSLSPSYFQTRVNTHPHKFLSEVETVLDFDFNESTKVQHIEQHNLVCNKDGFCHGIAFWFKLDFGDGISMTTEPENEWNCWMQAMSAFEVPVAVKAGQVLKVELTQTVNRIAFRLLNTSS